MFEQKKSSVRVLAKVSRGSASRLSDGRAAVPPPTRPGRSVFAALSGFPLVSMPSAAPTARQNAAEGKRSSPTDSRPPPPETSTLAAGRSEIRSRTERGGGIGAEGLGTGRGGDEGGAGGGSGGTGGGDGGGRGGGRGGGANATSMNWQQQSFY